jgi:hypothetical protein
MWEGKFWKGAAERAIRTAAQAVIALLSTDVAGILSVDWVQTASVAGMAAFLSVLMSIVATGVGDHESPSFVRGE